MKHFLSKRKNDIKMIIAVAIVIAMAIISAKSIYAIFTVTRTRANELSIQSAHTVTYTYYEVNRSGERSPIDRTDSFSDFTGTEIILGDDPSYSIDSERYYQVKYKIEGVEYEPGDTYVLPDRNVTIEQEYYVVKHNVTYDYATNGGQRSENDSTGSRVQEYNLGEEISLSETAYKNGWEFIGWNTNSAATTALSTLTMGTSDVTLYALYEKLAPDAPVVDIKLDDANGDEYAQNTWTNHDLYITLTPQSVEEDIAGYEIYLNGQWVSTGITMSGKTGTLLLTNDINDTVKFRSVDSLGNTSSETEVVIKRETVKPTMTFDGTLDKEGSWIRLTITTADQGGSGLTSSSGRYYVSTSPTSITGNSGTYSSGNQFSLYAPAGEDYYIFVEPATDHAGNYSGNDADLVTIDGVKYHRVGPYDRINPTVTIETVDYNTFRWTGVDTNTITDYGIIERVSASTAQPSEWTELSGAATGTYDIDTTSQKYYYVWVKDAQDNVGYGVIQSKKLEINTHNNTTVEIRNIDENGEVINPTYLLPGSNLYLTGTVPLGYHDLVINVNGTDYAPGTVYTTTNTTTSISSSASINTYNITYDFAGGQAVSGETLVTSIDYNTKFNVSNPAARPGYTFLGWTSSAEDGLGPHAKTGATSGSYLSAYVDWDGTATTNKGFYNLTDVNDGTVKLTATWMANAGAPVITAKLNDSTGANYSAGTWTNQNIYIELSQSDANNLIDHYEWYVNGEWVSTGITTTNNVGTLTINENINDTVRFRAVSITGHVSSESTLSVKRDDISPTIVYTATQSADYSKVSLSITCADTGGSGLFTGMEQGRTQFCVWKSTSPDSLSTTTHTNYSSNTDGTSFDINLSTTGDYYLFIQRIRDNAYNYSVSNADLVTIGGKDYYRLGPYRYDVTAPNVNIETVDYNTFRWTATDLSTIVAYNISRTTGSNAPTPSTWIDIDGAATGTYDIDTTGSYYYTVFVKDEYGNIGKKNISPSRLYRAEGTNTTLVIKENDANGHEFTNTNTYILNGTTLYVHTELIPSAGYSIKIDKTGNTIATGDTEATITVVHNAYEKIESVAVAYRYNIVYDYDGGVAGSGTNTTTAIYDSRFNTHTVAPTKEGYTFKGWTSSVQDGLGPNAKTAPTSSYSVSNFVAWDGSFTTNKGFLNLTDVNNGTVTLTAVWAKNNYEVLNGSNHVAYYENLADAIAGANTGYTIKVLDDVTDSSTLNIPSGKNLTLDLNGHTVSTSNTLTNNATLTIKDTNDEGTGKIVSSANTAITNNGTLTVGVNDSTISRTEPEISGAEYGVVNNAGKTFNFYDGIIKGQDGKSISGNVNIPTDVTLYKSTDNGVESAVLYGTARFNTGAYVNNKMKYLSTGVDNNAYDTINDVITAVKRYTGNNIPNDAVDVSVTDTPIMMWFDSTDNSIKWWTPDPNPELNPNSHGLFSYLREVTDIDLEDFDTSNVTVFSYMFYGCKKMDTFDLDNFDTSNATSIAGMFRGCTGMTEIDVSGFDTRKVRFFDQLFYGCNNLLELNVDNFETPAATSMQSMFGSCSKLTELDVSNFDTSNVISFNSMFSACRGLTELDVSNFDTQSATNMQYMFSSCSGLTELDVTHFNTSNVQNMQYMFSNCAGLTTLDLSSFETSLVTNMSYMFNNCNHLTTIYATEDFDTTAVTSSDNMFNSCYAPLDGGAGTTYDESNPKDKTYAHLDGGTSNPGYFRASPDVYKYEEVVLTRGIASVVARYTTLKDAFENVTNGHTIRVIADNFTDESDDVITLGTNQNTNISAILDLNGKTFTVEQRIINYGTLDIYNSSSTDAVLYTEAAESIFNLGTFTTNETSTANKVSIENNSTADYVEVLRNDNVAQLNANTVMEINYGPANSASTSNRYVVINRGTTTVNGAILKNTVGGESNKYGISNASSSSTARIIVNEGSSIVANSNAIINNGSTQTGNTAAIIVNGGSIYSEYNPALANYNGEARILGGTVHSGKDSAITVYGGSTVTIGNNDGTVVSSETAKPSITGATGVYISSGTLNFYDGVIIGDMGEAIYGAVTGKPADKAVCIYPRELEEVAILAGDAEFADGKTVNKAMKSLAAGTEVSSYSVADNSITAIARYTGSKVPNGVTYERVESDDSEAPIFMWYDSGTIYWWSSDSTPATNADASYMFYRLQNLTNIDGVSTFDTSSTTTMRAMFAKSDSQPQPQSPTNVDALEDWDVRNVTSIRAMFQNWRNLQDVDGIELWNTSSVESMSNLFRCNSLLADISGLADWDTQNVTEMDSLFYECSSLTSLSDIESWNTSSVETFDGMLVRCTCLTSIDLSSWDTSSAENMAGMFSGCSNVVVIDLTGFDTSSVTDMELMFSNDTSLTTIYASTNFVTTNVTDSTQMFDGCNVLDGGNGTTYLNANPKDKTYAHLDGGQSNPGYFRINTAVYPYVELNSSNAIVNQYMSLDEAFSNMTSGNTIKSLATQVDASSTSPTIASGKTVKLDLAGTNVSLTYGIRNSGTLDIYSSANGGGIWKDSTVITNLASGTLTTNATNNGSYTLEVINTSSTSNSTDAVIQNSGNVTLNTNTTLMFDSVSTEGTANRYVVLNLNSGSTTVDGATIRNTVGGTNKEYGISNATSATNAKIVVNSGTIETSANAIFNNGSQKNSTDDPAVKITGGNITSNVSSAIYNNISNSTIYMTNGTVLGKSSTAVTTYGTFIMDGGLLRTEAGNAVNFVGSANGTINGGTIEKDKPAGGSFQQGACVQVSTTGTINLNGGIIQNYNGSSSNVISIESSGTVIVDGATVQNLGAVQTVRVNAANASFILKSGTISSAGGAVIRNFYESSTASSYPNIRIEGGTVSTTGTRAVYNTSQYGRVIIYDGTITATGGNSNDMGAVENDGANGIIEIQGGTITATNSCGIHSSGGTVILGLDDDMINSYTNSEPKIEGARYGVRATSGTLRFYDGVIIGDNGSDSSISGVTPTLPTGYSVQKYLDSGKEIALIRLAITLNPNGGTYEGSSSTVTKYYEEGEDINLGVPTRSGYKFVRWKTSDGTIYDKNLLNGTETITFGSSSSNAAGTWRYASSGTLNDGLRTVINISDPPVPGVQQGFNIKANTNGGGSIDVAQDSIPVTEGQEYTFSVWAKGTGNLKIQAAKASPFTNKTFTLNNVTEWTKYSWTVTAGTGSGQATMVNGMINLYFGTYGTSGEIQICGMKMEEGNGFSDLIWSNPSGPLTLTAEWTQVSGGNSINEPMSIPEENPDLFLNSMQENETLSMLNQSALQNTVLNDGLDESNDKTDDEEDDDGTEESAGDGNDKEVISSLDDNNISNNDESQMIKEDEEDSESNDNQTLTSGE